MAEARVLAVDRSPEATTFAAVNAARNGVTLHIAVCVFGLYATKRGERLRSLAVR
jgi:methylase of polypeptide subunit release factors